MARTIPNNKLKNKNNDSTQEELQSQKRKKTFLDQEFDISTQYSRAEKFFELYKKQILIVLGVGLTILALYLAVKNIYLPSQEQAAMEEMYPAQIYFEKDSFKLALEGDGENPGFLGVIESNNGWTKAVNLAEYYAGICYLNMGQYEDAIKYLGKFSGNDEVVSSMALGATGDAYLELDNPAKALQYYKSAANNSRNDFSTPMYLLKSGILMERQGDKSGAASAYKQIRDQYPDSPQARDADKYLSRAEAGQ